MKYRLPWLCLAVAVPLLLLVWLGSPVAGSQQPAGMQKWDPALRAAAAATPENGSLRAIIYLHKQLDAASLVLPPGELARRTHIVSMLKTHASMAQADLLRELAQRQAGGAVTTIIPLWIVNAIVVKAQPEALAALSGRSDVAAVRLDAQLVAPEAMFEEAVPPNDAPWSSWQIRAPHVWAGLGIDGAGVVVANMDSGVDWTHPSLSAAYRGNQGGPVNHADNWFDVTDPANLAPIDVDGHGTHTMGTMVGSDGIGVAPGAQWMAVRIENDAGIILISYAHLGFQWSLAPNGNPANAPDIVNNSWGAADPGLTEFQPDVAALRAAGIVAVFSAGNSGSAPGTIAAPASYADTLAVGASDFDDQVAWFSSRGPSPLTAQPKPTLAAPGVRVLSTLPEGIWGRADGTSMAAPQVAGTLALLKSANGVLDDAALTQILTATAVVMQPPHPNQESGWGRLDAYGAVLTQVETGSLTGQITSGGFPLPGIAVTVTTPGGMDLPFVTGTNGRYNANLRPGTYSVRTAPYGFEPAGIGALVVTQNGITVADLALARLPHGIVTGIVSAHGGALPAGGVIRVADAPVGGAIANDGSYAIELPAGTYTFTAAATGYTLERAVVTVPDSQTVTQNFAVRATSRVLLVDGGAFVYQSQTAYYEEALAGIDLPYDLHTIATPFDPRLEVDDLMPYDVVIWSAPRYGLAYLDIAYGDVISDYLGTGGNFLVSGQDVGNYDGFVLAFQSWWTEQLHGVYLGDGSPAAGLTGMPGTPFSSLALSFNGGDSAGNQSTPDRVLVEEDTLTEPLLAYEDGAFGALHAGRCETYNIVYFGFGLEGVDNAGARAALIEGSFDLFNAPPETAGVRFMEDPIDDFITAGETLTYSLDFYNLSETVTDTFDIDVTGIEWSAVAVTPTVTLPPCSLGRTAVRVQAPDVLMDGATQRLTVTATSQQTSSATDAVEIYHHSPNGDVLLIDDDRFFDAEAAFGAALDSVGVNYEVWEIGPIENVRGTPPLELLLAYEFVVWYTAYDWFQPIMPDEMDVLEAFVARGGRLFLNSQDYLYYHFDEPLTRTYLGVADYAESISPTLLYGGNDPNLGGNIGGPVPLHFPPYQNNADGLVWTDASAPFVWGNRGLPAGTATAGAGWRTVFWSVPFEKMPPASQAIAMNRILGWLSDVGDSRWTVDERAAPAIDRSRTYTLAIRSSAGGGTVLAAVTNTIPLALALDETTLTGAVYDEAARQVRWQGTVAPGETHLITYEAKIEDDIPAGTRIDNPVMFGVPGNNLRFDRVVSTWHGVNALSGTQIAASATNMPPSGGIVTANLRVRNDAASSAQGISSTLYVPGAIITESIQASSGSITGTGRLVFWRGDVGPSSTVTVTVAFTVSSTYQDVDRPVVVYLDDGATDVRFLVAQISQRPLQLHFPLLFETNRQE